jgi:hypothetical protein
MLSNRATWKWFWHPMLWSVSRDIGRQTVPCRRWTPLDPDVEGVLSHTCTVSHSPPHRLPPPPHSPRATRLAPTGRPRRPCRNPTNCVAAIPCSRAPPCRAPFRGRVETCSPRHTRLYKGQKLPDHARCAVAQSRAAPLWPSTPSSRAHSVSQPSAPIGSFARTYWSSPSHTLPGANRRLAGAKPQAAATASLRRAAHRQPFPPQTSTQTGPRRTLDPAQALPRPTPPPASPDFPWPRRPQSSRATLQGPRYF